MSVFFIAVSSLSMGCCRVNDVLSFLQNVAIVLVILESSFCCMYIGYVLACDFC